MKCIRILVAMLLVAAACNLTGKFRNSNSSNSNSTSSSKVGNDPVEKPNPTAAQKAALANGESVPWAQQGITWTLPPNWKKQDVRNETLSYGGNGAFLSVNISTMGSSFPTDAIIKAMTEDAKPQKKQRKHDQLKCPPLTHLLGVAFPQPN